MRHCSFAKSGNNPKETVLCLRSLTLNVHSLCHIHVKFCKWLQRYIYQQQRRRWWQSFRWSPGGAARLCWPVEWSPNSCSCGWRTRGSTFQSTRARLQGRSFQEVRGPWSSPWFLTMPKLWKGTQYQQPRLETYSIYLQASNIQTKQGIILCIYILHQQLL